MENKKILVVGAGGIGCELLKTLVLTGANDLTVVDLDLIDKSNLNRQFLFKRCDVGMPKALVAANVISSLRPDVKIQGMHQDIFKLKTDFFEGFDLIFNALDNLGARRYVNRNCVFLGKTFIDAGTQSKTGQVTVHIPKKSLCYDCMPKQSPKQYPVCTIRSTPSLIVHCIAWGKYLYEALFGPEDPSNILSELSSFKQNSPIELFNHLFNSDLPAQASPLTFPSEVESQLYKDQYSILSYLQLVNTFHFTFSSLKSRPPSPFDKNDNLAVHFVSSVSNLRALNFSIGLESMNKVQQIAGNIIPAIGSTNAIVAGLQVIEGIKVLNGGKNFGAVWVQESRSHNKYIFPTALEEKNDSCFVCSSGKWVETVDFDKVTLAQFIQEVLINKLNFKEPSLYKNDSLLFESGEGIEEEFLEIYEKNALKTLRMLNVEEELYCEVWNIQDFSQNCRFYIVLKHKVQEDAENPQDLKRPRDLETIQALENNAEIVE